MAEKKSRIARLTSLDAPTDGDWVDTALEIGAGFTPLQYPQAARDFERARRADDTLGMGLAGLAAIPVAGGIAKAAGKLRKTEKLAEHIDFPIANVRRNNGAIGTQGVTESQIYDVLTHAAGMKLDSSMSMRDMVNAFKSDFKAQKKLRDFTKANPISVTPLPDGSFHLQDGHHRTFLLNQIGDQTVPALPFTKKRAGGMIENTTHDRKLI